jgi:hypothetical protein
MERNKNRESESRGTNQPREHQEKNRKEGFGSQNPDQGEHREESGIERDRDRSNRS